MSEAEQVAERVFQSVLGTLESFSIYIGDRLGLYEGLRDAPGSTPGEIGRATGCDERYVREWLEHQAVSGLVAVDNHADASQRRYSLEEGAAEVLAQPDSLNYMAAFVRMAVSTGAVLPELLEAFRSGGGVPWSSYGADAREGQADINKPIFLQLIGQWFEQVPALHQRLSAGDARIADVGCGGGWSSLAMARAYPGVHVDGFDVDAPSIDLARANTKGTDVEDRVAYTAEDAGDASLSHRYDVVTVFEALHDMSRPVEVLRKLRGLLADGGSVVVVDERVAERFEAPGDDIEKLMYGWSVMCCLATGMSEQPSAGTGTVMRPGTLRAYAREAGFNGEIETYEIGHPFFRLYRLVP
jgi:2-polyprenyl-3-methyl-5-hydroxy-6-metoxy-1,4-benzoquinol methylase